MKRKKSNSQNVFPTGVDMAPDVPGIDSDELDGMVDAGSRQMQRDLQEHHAVSPILSGGDVDAAWQEAESTGEETPGGHAPTPDQDEVDEIGRAYGMEIPDNQELHTHDEILGERDKHRWELDKRSADKSNDKI